MRHSKITVLYCTFYFVLLITGSSFTIHEIDGSKIYKQYCKSCHGRKGGLGLQGATNLKNVNLTLDQRIISIREGKGKMVAFKNILSKEEIEAVARFTESLKK